MTKKLLVLVPLLIGLPLFATGALRRPPVAPLPSFIDGPFSLPPEYGTTPADWLNRALERLSPDRVTWLETRIRQRRLTGAIPFESEGKLLLGPDHCARLELTVQTGAMSGRWLVVSDGHAYAHVSQVASDTPTVTSGLLAPLPQPDQPTPRSRTELLRDLGCGGPLLLLQDVRSRLQDLVGQTGRYHGQPVLRIHGRLSLAGAVGAQPKTADAADFCYLYLDARTLWPSRVEWWGASRKEERRLLLEIEFQGQQLNRPLSHEECVRAFTYRPESTP
jgi:hypothetical protein